MPNKSARWTGWYANNRENYLAERRNRYRKNAGDRQDANDRAQRSNERRGQYWKKHKWSQAPVLMEIEMQGRTRRVLMFPVAYLARTLGRQTQIVRLWDERGVIPKTPYRVTRGRREYRLYSSGMMKSVTIIVGNTLNGGVVKSAMKDKIVQAVRAAWRKLGVPGMDEVHTDGGARERRNGNNSTRRKDGGGVGTRSPRGSRSSPRSSSRESAPARG